MSGRSWSASALAAVLTAGAVAVLAMAVSGVVPGSWGLPEPADQEMAERITYVTPPIASPRATVVPPTAAPATTAAPRAAPQPAAPPRIVAPTTPRLPLGVPDTAVGAARPNVRFDPSAPSIPLAPLPGAKPTTTCAAPCAEGTRAGFAERSNLSREQMDSVLELMAAAAAEKIDMSAGRTHAIAPPPRATGEAQIGGGVSVPVGLPGGGPSAKQRARDRKLYAQNLESLARIKARADSVIAARRDSIRRAAIVRDSTRRVKPDSTGE